MHVLEDLKVWNKAMDIVPENLVEPIIKEVIEVQKMSFGLIKHLEK